VGGRGNKLASARGDRGQERRRPTWEGRRQGERTNERLTVSVAVGFGAAAGAAAGVAVGLCAEEPDPGVGDAEDMGAGHRRG